MKKWMMVLVALAAVAQAHAETLVQALGEQGRQYLAAINSAQIQEFQQKKREFLNKELDKDLDAVTPAQLKEIAQKVEDFAGVVAGSLGKTSPTTPEGFDALVKHVKAQLEALAQPKEQAPVRVQSEATDAASSNVQFGQEGWVPQLEVHSDKQFKGNAYIEELKDRVKVLNDMRKNNESSSDFDEGDLSALYQDIFDDLIAHTAEGALADETMAQGVLEAFLKDLGLTEEDYDQVLSRLATELYLRNEELSMARPAELDEVELALPMHPSLKPHKAKMPVMLEEEFTAADSPMIYVTDTALEDRINRIVSTDKAMLDLAQQLAREHRVADAAEAVVAEGELENVRDETDILLSQLTERQLQRLASDIEDEELLAALTEIERGQLLRELNDLEDAQLLAQLTPQDAAALAAEIDAEEQKRIEEMAEAVSSKVIAQAAQELYSDALRQHQQEEEEFMAASLGDDAISRREALTLEAEEMAARIRRKKELVTIMIECFEKSQKPVEELSAHNAAVLIGVQGNAELLQEIRELVGDDAESIRKALPPTMNDRQQTQVVRYIMSLLHPQATSTGFVIDVRRLNKAMEDSATMQQYKTLTVFMEHYKTIFEKLVDQVWDKNGGQFLSEQECKEALVGLFAGLGLIESDYDRVLPLITLELVAIQDAIWAELELDEAGKAAQLEAIAAELLAEEYERAGVERWLEGNKRKSDSGGNDRSSSAKRIKYTPIQMPEEMRSYPVRLPKADVYQMFGANRSKMKPANDNPTDWNEVD